MNSPYFNIKQNFTPIFRKKYNKSYNLSTNKRNNYITINYQNNRNYNKDILKTNYNNFNQESSMIHNNNYYYQHYHRYNNNEKIENKTDIIITIKKSFERLKNQLNSLQNIINNNSI